MIQNLLVVYNNFVGTRSPKGTGIELESNDYHEAALVLTIKKWRQSLNHCPIPTENTMIRHRGMTASRKQLGDKSL